MKKKYEKPEFKIECFKPNEFNAACGYTFTCNAGRYGSFIMRGNLWFDNGNFPGEPDENDQLITVEGTVFEACDFKQEISKEAWNTQVSKGWFKTRWGASTSVWIYKYDDPSSELGFNVHAMIDRGPISPNHS